MCVWCIELWSQEMMKHKGIGYGVIVVILINNGQRGIIPTLPTF